MWGIFLVWGIGDWGIGDWGSGGQGSGGQGGGGHRCHDKRCFPLPTSRFPLHRFPLPALPLYRFTALPLYRSTALPFYRSLPPHAIRWRDGVEFASQDDAVAADEGPRVGAKVGGGLVGFDDDAGVGEPVYEGVGEASEACRIKVGVAGDGAESGGGEAGHGGVLHDGLVGEDGFDEALHFVGAEEVAGDEGAAGPVHHVGCGVGGGVCVCGAGGARCGCCC
ncbi:MAG: hypothetical protein EI684_10140 [Candidatus Viridilinea halotolerans]|uniref:Uncharacterized protein n=1 Tax=Candidatus Viridilinea halotolerans TaxID=2491704 RepID=A0A426U0I7_9CHLR|nr:MAG: hypothetical protein EI684_10140 [Candidatus Viridilinea halotolerans]